MGSGVIDLSLSLSLISASVVTMTFFILQIWDEVLASAAQDNTMNCDVDPFRVPITAPGFDSIGVVAVVTSSRTPDFGALIDFRARGINYNYTTNMCTSVGACNDFWVVGLSTRVCSVSTQRVSAAPMTTNDERLVFLSIFTDVGTMAF